MAMYRAIVYDGMREKVKYGKPMGFREAMQDADRISIEYFGGLLVGINREVERVIQLPSGSWVKAVKTKL
jgi:hypothetical protein